MYRPLGRFELAQVLTDRFSPLNAVVTVRLENGPAPAVLRDVLGAVAARHPLLGVRVVREGRRFAFSSDGVGEIPVRDLDREGESHWRAVVEGELDRRFDLGRGPLLRVCRLRSGTGRAEELVLTFQHVVMDASSGARLVHEILSSCAGSPIAGGPRPVLPAIEALFPPPYRGLGRLPRWGAFLAREMAGEIVDRWERRGEGVEPVRLDARNRVLSFELPREETRALTRRVRHERISLASALSAALQLATARKFFGAGGELRMRSMSFPDLRPYLRPPPDEEDLACCFVFLRTRNRLDPRAGLWQLARRVNEVTRRALRRGDKYAAAWFAPSAMRAALRSPGARMAETALSYTGNLDLLPTYGETRLSDLHAFVSNIPIGPLVTGSARLAGGGLTWDLVYLDTDLDRGEARSIREEVLGLLREAAVE